MKDIIKAKNHLQNKLVKEGLTKIEKGILDELEVIISEDSPMSFDDVGGARPDRSLQSKIERGELPISKLGLTQEQVDFFTSQAFKESLNKLERLFGQNSGIDRRLTMANQNLRRDAQTAFGMLMSLVAQLMSELVMLQNRNRQQLEKIATESVEKVMGIDRMFFEKKLKLDGKFIDGFLDKLEGMKEQIEDISDEEIEEKFADIDEEKKNRLEQLKKDFEELGVDFDEEKAKEAIESTFEMSPETKAKAKKAFSDEVSRRMIINLFRRGMSLYYSNAYDLCSEKIKSLPGGERIIQLSNVLQPVMSHMYWLFPDIGGIATSGGGQIGQIEIKGPEQGNDGDEEEKPKKRNQPPRQESPKEEPKGGQTPKGPFIIRARAATLPLIVHELVKGTIMFFTSAGGKVDEKSQLAKKQATSLEVEAYDLVYGEKFYIEFYKIYNKIVPNMEEQRELTPFVLKFLSEDKYENLVDLTKSLFTLGLERSGFAEQYIEKLVEKARNLRQSMEKNPSYRERKKY